MRRHSAEVTADRLRDAVAKWSFDGGERDMIGHLIHALDQIAESERR